MSNPNYEVVCQYVSFQSIELFDVLKEAIGWMEKQTHYPVNSFNIECEPLSDYGEWCISFHWDYKHIKFEQIDCDCSGGKPLKK